MLKSLNKVAKGGCSDFYMAVGVAVLEPGQMVGTLQL